MQPKPHLKELAHALYFQTNSTQKEIAELVGVHRRTVHMWIKHGDWQKTKAAAHRSPQLLVHDLYNQLEEMNTLIRSREPGYRIPTREEADIIRRLTMSIKDIDRRPLSDAVFVLEELTTNVFNSEPELAKRIIPYADRLIRRKNRHMDYYTSEEEEENDITGIAAG